MIYYLTDDQWCDFWTLHSIRGIPPLAVERIQQWNKHFKPKYNLQYDEETDATKIGYYGVIIGEGKHINWFLLQI
jgi:hypothetical protein